MKPLVPILLLAAAAITPAQAVVVTMTAGDGFGTSSFNSAGQWDSAAAPTAGNSYFNAGNLLRTPDAGSGSFTFEGDSLTITGGGLATVANNEALMFKGSGTGAIITVSTLTIDGGQLRHGQASGDSFTLAGNLIVGANGANFATQGGMTIASNISGSNTIRVLDNGNGDVARTIFLGSAANTFTGDIELFGSSSGFARISLTDGANLNFTIGSNGANNSVFGTGNANFDGDFFFDLSGADATLGNMWTITNASVQSFGSTFTVDSFVDAGGDQWTQAIDASTSFLFDEATGTLSVIPEPSAALLGALGMIALIRRRRN
jgi:MYXO-CTERM domain-containing protein